MQLGQCDAMESLRRPPEISPIGHTHTHTHQQLQYSALIGRAGDLATQDEQFIDQHFVQHVLADLAWEQLCSKYVEKRLVQDQLRLLRRRCEFHKAAYKGLSGAHAWALEALGDCLRSVAKKGAVGAEDNLKVARQKYSEATATCRCRPVRGCFRKPQMLS